MQTRGLYYSMIFLQIQLVTNARCHSGQTIAIMNCFEMYDDIVYRIVVIHENRRVIPICFSQPPCKIKILKVNWVWRIVNFILHWMYRYSVNVLITKFSKDKRFSKIIDLLLWLFSYGSWNLSYEEKFTFYSNCFVKIERCF